MRVSVLVFNSHPSLCSLPSWRFWFFFSWHWAGWLSSFFHNHSCLKNWLHGEVLSFFKFFFFFKSPKAFCIGGIADKQCCGSFWQTTKGLSHAHTRLRSPPNCPPGCHITISRVPWRLLMTLELGGPRHAHDPERERSKVYFLFIYKYSFLKTITKCPPIRVWKTTTQRWLVNLLEMSFQGSEAGMGDRRYPFCAWVHIFFTVSHQEPRARPHLASCILCQPWWDRFLCIKCL